MGFVSTLVINNDLLHAVKEDKNFGDKVYDAVISLNSRQSEIGIVCGPGTAATAVQCHHASTGKALIVGGGTFFTKIEDIYLSECRLDPEFALLKALAEKHGFNLHRKPVR